MTQSIEEAWEGLNRRLVGLLGFSTPETLSRDTTTMDAARAVALASFWAGVNVGGSQSRHADIVAEARRIEELGR